MAELNAPEILALPGLVRFLIAKLTQAAEDVQSTSHLDPEHGHARRLLRLAGSRGVSYALDVSVLSRLWVYSDTIVYTVLLVGEGD